MRRKRELYREKRRGCALHNNWLGLPVVCGTANGLVCKIPKWSPAFYKWLWAFPKQVVKVI